MVDSSVGSSVGSCHLNLPPLETLVLDPRLLLLHPVTFLQTATPSMTTMFGQRTQGCRQTIPSLPQPSPLPQRPSNPP